MKYTLKPVQFRPFGYQFTPVINTFEQSMEKVVVLSATEEAIKEHVKNVYGKEFAYITVASCPVDPRNGWTGYVIQGCVEGSYEFRTIGFTDGPII
jgi:hypothetical protein